MIRKLRAMGLAAALALAPIAAGAITLSSDNTVIAGQTINVVTDRAYHWDANFLPAPAPAGLTADTRAATYTFVFRNAGTRWLGLNFTANVRQLSAYFAGGAKVTFGNLVLSVPQTVRQKGIETPVGTPIALAPGQQLTLKVATLGRTVKSNATNATNPAANINFDVMATVPVPATGGLLVAGLAGLGLLRRRRAA